MPASPATVRGEDGRRRCFWGASTPDYERYHDEEWGRPVTDDRGMFERLVLEGFQSGLSWLTILRKRDNFRAAFANFEIEAVARFGARDVRRLLNDAGIVRHRGKIEAAIANAKAAAALDVPLRRAGLVARARRSPARAARARRASAAHARVDGPVQGAGAPPRRAPLVADPAGGLRGAGRPTSRAARSSPRSLPRRGGVGRRRCRCWAPARQSCRDVLQMDWLGRGQLGGAVHRA